MAELHDFNEQAGNDINLEIKGLKRIDKLFRLNPRVVKGLKFDLNHIHETSIVDALSTVQQAGIDLVIIKLPAADNEIAIDKRHVSFYEKMHDFRKQIFIPVVIDIDHKLLDEDAVEHLCKQTAAIAIDGFTTDSIEPRDFTDKFKPGMDKYGLSFVFPVNNLQAIADMTRSQTYPGAIFYLKPNMELDNSIIETDSDISFTVFADSDVYHKLGMPVSINAQILNLDSLNEMDKQKLGRDLNGLSDFVKRSLG